MRRNHWSLLTTTLLFTAGLGLPAQTHQHLRASSARTSGNAQACFDPTDPRDVRLWKSRAPGATGDDPCRDIPFLRVFQAQSSAHQPGTAILVIGGGGYDRLTNTKEQAPVAEYFSSKLGMNAFVLYYRLVQPDGTYRYPVPMWDGQRAIKLLRAQAAEIGVDPGRVIVFGFSAGGHLASTLALHSASDFDLPAHDAVDAQRGRPDLLGLGYPVISMDPADVPPSGSFKNLLRGFQGAELRHLQTYLSGEKNVTAHTPSVFLFESMDDARISPQNSLLFVDALRQQGIPVDVHLFAHGEHGAGLAQGIPEEGAWPEMFGRWVETQGFLQK